VWVSDVNSIRLDQPCRQLLIHACMHACMLFCWLIFDNVVILSIIIYYTVTGSENGNCVLYDLVRASTVQVLNGDVSKEESINNPMCSIAAHPKLASCLVTARFDGPVTVWSNEIAVPDSLLVDE
jgi:hypothetical protein